MKDPFRMIAKLIAAIGKIIRHPVSRNALALYGLRVAVFALPLLTIPYLARVLQPAGWGTVVFAQTYAIWLWLLLEYGFNFTATREIARHRDDRDKITRIVSGVLGAKGILALAAIGITLLVGVSSDVFRRHPDYLLWAMMYSLLQGMSPLWYFQGVERMGMRVLVDIAIRIGVTAGIFLVVKSPADGAWVLALQALGSLLSTGILLTLMYREVAWRRPGWGDALLALRQGWNMFIFRGGSSLYTVANTFILGLYLPPAAVAFYGGADKIVCVIKGFMEPISQAVFPRMSHLLARQPDRAVVFARLLVIGMSVLGIILGGSIYLAGPLLVHLLLGATYQSTVPVLQVLSLSIPIIAVGTALGVQWLLPLGLDRQFSYIVVGAGLLNLGMARLLVPAFGPVGMAWSVVATEAAVVLGLLFVIFWHRRNSRQVIKNNESIPERLERMPAA